MCRCQERKAALSNAARSVARGDIARIIPAAKYVVRTLAQDVRNGSLQHAAAQRLAALRSGRR